MVISSSIQQYGKPPTVKVVYVAQTKQEGDHLVWLSSKLPTDSFVLTNNDRIQKLEVAFRPVSLEQ